MVITFFTFWVLILVILQKYTKHYIDLLYISFITLVIGMYLSYIHPQYFKFTLFDETFKLTSLHKLVIVDCFIHILCFLYVWLYLKNNFLPFSADYRFYTSLILIAIYMLTINIRNVYNVGVFELFCVFIIANMLYVIIFVKK